MAQMLLSKKHKEVLRGNPGTLGGSLGHLPKSHCTPPRNCEAEDGPYKNLTLMGTVLPCLTTGTPGTFVDPEGKAQTAQEQHLFATPPISPQAGDSSHPSPQLPPRRVSNNGVKFTAFADKQPSASHVS